MESPGRNRRRISLPTAREVLGPESPFSVRGVQGCIESTVGVLSCFHLGCWTSEKARCSEDFAVSRLCAQLWTKAEKNADARAVLFSINLELRKGERLREKTNGTSSGCSDPLAALNLDPWNREA